MPALAFAQTITTSCGTAGGVTGGTVTNSGTIETIICRIDSILNTIVPVLIVLGVVYFIWGVISYVIGSDEEAKKAGRDRIIFGIIGLAVIIGVWGLVAILNRTFNSSVTGAVSIPCIAGTPGC